MLSGWSWGRRVRVIVVGFGVGDGLVTLPSKSLSKCCLLCDLNLFSLLSVVMSRLPPSSLSNGKEHRRCLLPFYCKSRLRICMCMAPPRTPFESNCQLHRHCTPIHLGRSTGRRRKLTIVPWAAGTSSAGEPRPSDSLGHLQQPNFPSGTWREMKV